MINIIDYGLKNLYEVLYHSNYDSIDVKIDGIEQTLTVNNPVTIHNIPDQVFKKVYRPAQKISYVNDEGLHIDVLEWTAQYNQLREFGYYDDDDNFIFETREDKQNYDNFCSTWTAVYSEPETDWEPIEFKIIQKQFIEEKYQPFIRSQIVIPTKEWNKPEPDPIHAICTYSPSFEGMFRSIANSFGFQEVEDKSFVDNTNGKKYSFHSGIKYSKCNGQYVDKYFENKFILKPVKGSYEDCIKGFERDYNEIYTYLNIQLQSIEGKAVEPLTVKTLLDLILNIKDVHRQISVMKTSRNANNRLGKLLVDLENKLLGGH